MQKVKATYHSQKENGHPMLLVFKAKGALDCKSAIHYNFCYQVKKGHQH